MSEISFADKKSSIIDCINELSVPDKVEVLQMIYNSASRGKLKEKGSGTEIKIESMSKDMIEKIYVFINIKLEDQYLDLG